MKLINYIYDALYFSNNEEFRLIFEQLLNKRFNLSLLGQAKWYLRIKIKQPNNHKTLDQEQFIKNIVNVEKGLVSHSSINKAMTESSHFENNK